MAHTDTHKSHELERRGLLFVLSSPSGAGKSTLSRMLLNADAKIALSVSYTTREPRPGEIEGVHYHFTDTATFKKMAADGEFLEWAKGRYDIDFLVVEGIMHQPQPAATLETLRRAVAARGAFELAAMAKLAHLSGSLVATLAIIERAGTAEDIWKAACLDEIWQEELWGADHWAQKNRSDREGEFMAAVRFLDLLIAET